MAQYGNFNKRSGDRRIVIAAVCAFVVILAAIYIIGVFTGSDAERVSAAVKENVRLKEQVAEMSERIAYLETENEELRASIALAPTPEPTSAPQESAEPNTVQNALPRGGR